MRKELYKLIQIILKLDRLTQRRTLEIINDKHTIGDKPRIYACTHVARYDIESSLEAINEQAWFMMGDPGIAYKTIDGLLLELYGSIYVDTWNKPDRKASLVKSIDILNKGGNILIFPEGAWNLSPVNPVQQLFSGAAIMAIETGAEVIPIGIEQKKKSILNHYYVNIGENLNFTGAKITDKSEVSREIQEHMAACRYEIWEKCSKTSREELQSTWADEYKNYIDSIMCDTENGYTIEEIEKTRYRHYDKDGKPLPDENTKYLKLLF